MNSQIQDCGLHAKFKVYHRAVICNSQEISALILHGWYVGLDIGAGGFPYTGTNKISSLLYRK